YSGPVVVVVGVVIVVNQVVVLRQRDQVHHRLRKRRDAVSRNNVSRERVCEPLSARYTPRVGIINFVGVDRTAQSIRANRVGRGETRIKVRAAIRRNRREITVTIGQSGNGNIEGEQRRLFKPFQAEKEEGFLASFGQEGNGPANRCTEVATAISGTD